MTYGLTRPRAESIKTEILSDKIHLSSSIYVAYVMVTQSKTEEVFFFFNYPSTGQCRTRQLCICLNKVAGAHSYAKKIIFYS